MIQTAAHRVTEADRLLNEPLLKQALAAMEQRALDELLAGAPMLERDKDRWRRERIDTINVIRGIPTALRGALVAAEAELRERGGVA